jgi:hypothetical protein
MKRIVRLTESDLTKIVRKVVRESRGLLMEGTGYSVATSVKSLIADAGITNWWNKSDILAQLKKLKVQADYNECKLNLNKNRTVYDYIVSELGTTSYDKSQSAAVNNPLSDLGTGLTDKEFNNQMWSILSKFQQ